MGKEAIRFAVQKTDSVITGVGKSYISYPKIQFNGNGIRWHEDKPRQKNRNKNG